MKVNTELERIADLSTNIAKCILFVASQPQFKQLKDMENLFNVSRSMVTDAVTAFVNRDRDLAKKIIQMDEVADNLRTKIQDELVNGYMTQDKTLIPRAVSLFLITRHYERMCDHATNIAEDVIFMIDARMVKHHPEILDAEQGPSNGAQ
jgi:phosphate transport system protein